MSYKSNGSRWKCVLFIDFSFSIKWFSITTQNVKNSSFRLTYVFSAIYFVIHWWTCVRLKTQNFIVMTCFWYSAGVIPIPCHDIIALSDLLTKISLQPTVVLYNRLYRTWRGVKRSKLNHKTLYNIYEEPKCSWQCRYHLSFGWIGSFVW